MNAILAVSLGAAVFLIAAYNCAGALADLLGAVGDPILRWLGVQGDGRPGIEFVGREALILRVAGDEIRAELDGTSWPAIAAEANWTPAPGERATIVAIDGLKLRLTPKR